MRRLVVFVALAVGLYAQPEYSVHTVAGSDWVGDGGPARQALLLQAEGVAVDRSGNLYIADAASGSVRQVDTRGIVHTVAAGLAAPYGLAIDPTGFLHIAELGAGRVVRLERDGSLTTILDALRSPRNLAFDRAGNLYISDFDAHTVYRHSAGGTTTVVAGPNVLAFPTAVAVDAAGVLYIADSQHHVIHKVEGAAVTEFASAGTPTGMAFNAAGVLHVADAFTGQVLRFGVNGALTPLHVAARDVAFGPDGAMYASEGEFVRRIGNGVNAIFAGGGNRAHGDHGPAVAARLNGPSGVAVDAIGNLYIADRDNHRVRRVSPDGIITTYAGAGLPGSSGDGGVATRALLHSPHDVAVDAADNVFIADRGNRRIRVVTPGGITTTLVNGINVATVGVDASGNLFATDDTFTYRVGSGGSLTRVGAPTGPTSLTADLAGRAIDASGVIYVPDAGAHRVYAYVPLPEPVIEISAVHAATRQPVAAAAPGMLLVLRGVPEGAEIRANGIVVPELARTVAEVTIRVPALADILTMEVRRSGSIPGLLSLPLVAAAPGLFAAVTPDGSAPERGGVVVLYGTGEGMSEAPVSVTIGGYAAEVLYSGTVAAYPGLWQMNVGVPAGYLPPGDQPVIVSIAGFSSPPLTVSLK